MECEGSAPLFAALACPLNKTIKRGGNPDPRAKNGAKRPHSEKLFRSVGARGGQPFAFGHGYGLGGGDVRQMIHLAAGPANFDRFGLVMLREAEGENEFA